MSGALSVFIGGQSVGEISRDGDGGEVVFRRISGARQTISLAFPQDDSVVGSGSPRRLHPVFEQHLPEGVLRERIETAFARELPGRDDLTILRIVGHSLVGRMRFARDVDELGDPPEIPLGSIVSGSIDAAIDRLMEQYAAFSGVSGAQPKVLVRDGGGKDRFTVRGTTHILKTFDPNDFPHLGSNELACLQAAKAAGLAVPETELSSDGRWLAIRRFDIDPEQPGGYLAFEDLCSLGGSVSEHKYVGSYEQIAKLVRSHSADPAADLEKLFLMLSLNCVLRNGDAHRKNFGMLYGEGVPPMLAPTFDIICTALYPQLSDRMALMLEGKNTWPTRKQLERFGMNSCLMGRDKVASAMERTAVAAVDASRLARDFGMPDDEADTFIGIVETAAAGISRRLGHGEPQAGLSL